MHIVAVLLGVVGRQQHPGWSGKVEETGNYRSDKQRQTERKRNKLKKNKVSVAKGAARNWGTSIYFCWLQDSMIWYILLNQWKFSLYHNNILLKSALVNVTGTDKAKASEMLTLRNQKKKTKNKKHQTSSNQCLAERNVLARLSLDPCRSNTRIVLLRGHIKWMLVDRCSLPFIARA